MENNGVLVIFIDRQGSEGRLLKAIFLPHAFSRPTTVPPHACGRLIATGLVLLLLLVVLLLLLLLSLMPPALVYKHDNTA